MLFHNNNGRNVRSFLLLRTTLWLLLLLSVSWLSTSPSSCLPFVSASSSSNDDDESSSSSSRIAKSVKKILDKADKVESVTEAMELYEMGAQYLRHQHHDDDNDDDNRELMLLKVKLYANLGKVYKMKDKVKLSLQSHKKVIDLYKSGGLALAFDDETETALNMASIASWSAFHMGVAFEDKASKEQQKDNHEKAERFFAEAIKAYNHAIDINSLHWPALTNLGTLYRDTAGDTASALDSLNKAWIILKQISDRAAAGKENEKPDVRLFQPPKINHVMSDLQYQYGLTISLLSDDDCQENVEYITVKQQKDEEIAATTKPTCKEIAAKSFEMAAELNRHNDKAKQMFVITSADVTTERASNPVVQDLFDGYAERFEHILTEQLDYTGYEQIRAGFDRALLLLEKNDDNKKMDYVLDAGCGTGLVGKEFRNVSTHLIGVDLSPAMIDQATTSRPDLYDQTVVGDIVHVLTSKEDKNEFVGKLSLVVAGDSFLYFSALDALVAAMYEGLAVGGYAAFTLENVSTEHEKILSKHKSDWKWFLSPSGRFAHRKSYVVNVIRQHGGFDLIHYEALDGFRTELSKNVRGHLFVLQKTDKKKSEDDDDDKLDYDFDFDEDDDDHDEL